MTGVGLRTFVTVMVVLVALAAACSSEATLSAVPSVRGADSAQSADPATPSPQTPQAEQPSEEPGNDTESSDESPPGNDSTTSPDDEPQPAPTPAVARPLVVDDTESLDAFDANSIAIATATGDVVVVDADSGALKRVAINGQQPVFSPDGSRLAWNEQTADGDFASVSVDAEFGDRRSSATPFFGYYGFWDPTSQRLATLGNAPPGTGLVLDELGSEALSVVGSDGFYFFSWSPDGSRWVVRGTSGLRIADASGEGPLIDLELASFNAPIWTADNRIIIAVRNGAGASVVTLDPDSLETTTLFDTDDVVRMVLDPTGRYLAVESVVAASPDDTAVQEVAFRQAAVVAKVQVHDLVSGTTVAARDDGVLAMWWSPSGDHLAMLVPASGSQLRWTWWAHDGAVTQGEPHRLLPLYASTYLPFYDQFAQSMTPWSPDGARFVYTGAGDDGRFGVFIAEIADPTEPVWVSASGDVALWAPG